MASGTFDLSVDSIAAGDTLHREFWTALRDGAPLDTAVSKFQGASQTIENAKATSNGQPVGSLQRMVASNIGYKAGLPVSIDLDVSRLDFDPVILPDPGIADTLAGARIQDGHARRPCPLCLGPGGTNHHARPRSRSSWIRAAR